MIEPFELAQASKCELLGASKNGEKILDTRCEFDCESKFTRLSVESFPDLQGPQLEAFKDVCFNAHKSEEFFLSINAENQWIRTTVGHKKVHSETWTKSSISDFIIQSNVLPYNPYWSQVWDGANMGVHFPSRMLQEAVREGKSWKSKLQEWRDGGGVCMIGMHKPSPQSPSQTWFWEIKDVEVVHDSYIATDISRVKWRGGRFVKKKTGLSETTVETGLEFEIVKRICTHPNIVYGFGELRDGSAYFMECMSNDLGASIIESQRVDPSLPPFTSHDTLDILLQFAEAMKHMHQQGVVHNDLKSANILICKIAISENASHYLVKVADFGSARYMRPLGFEAGPSTDVYAAPEALQQRKNQSFSIDDPDRIDVYSFGIVAYEVITGQNYYNHMLSGSTPKSRKKFRRSVIDEDLRPPLRQKSKEMIILSQKNKGIKQTLVNTWDKVGSCMKNIFMQDKDVMPLTHRIDTCWHLQNEELLSLIESCWHPDPSRRPTFAKTCDELKKVKDQNPEKIMKGDHPPCRANSVAGSSRISKIGLKGERGAEQQALESSLRHKRPRSSSARNGEISP